MTPAWPIGIKKSPSTLEIDSRTDMWLKPANERTGNQELSFFWASWRIEGDGAMGISSHLSPLWEGLPRRKPPRGKKRTKAWSPDLRARSKHLDTAMPEDIPWIFSVTCTSIFPFLHKPVWVEFLTHSAVAPARYDKLLSSKAQLKYHLLLKTPPTSLLHHWWPRCFPPMLCHDYPMHQYHHKTGNCLRAGSSLSLMAASPKGPQ